MEHSTGLTYERLYADFSWAMPPRFNMGVACADRHAPDAVGLVEIHGDDQRVLTFGELTDMSNRLANALAFLGVELGDRIGIVLPQCAEAGIAHLATYKLGAIAVPMSVMFGAQALTYRLADCNPKIVITATAHLDAVAEVAKDIEDGPLMVLIDGAHKKPHRSFWGLVAGGSASFTAAETTPDTPALLIYTSGTTGRPKGVLHGHRVLLGHLPGFELSHDLFGQAGDRLWTPADWSWIAGLMDALMPTWYHGYPIVAAARGRFDPEWAMHLMAATQVRNAFIPPTALKLMRQAEAGHSGVALRTLMSGGESLGEEMLSWAREVLGITINEIYGQTEANYLIGNSHQLWDVTPGSMGLPYPGHTIVLLDPDEQPVAAGTVGEVAVGLPDPVSFLGYWNQPEATRAKLSSDGEWLLTGDLAHADERGYLWFQSRSDDIINSAGYRIGPAEIEDCLMRHPAVALAAAVGVPDPIRGQVVKAVIQLARGHVPTPELEIEIRELVRARLAGYEYPREIEFVDELPLTSTGKIRRSELRQTAEQPKPTLDVMP